MKLWLLAAVAPLLANDTLVTLGAGGLVPRKTAAIAMESEDLEVSAREIRVRYIFRNKTERDIEATVAFPLPDLVGGDFTHEPFELPSKDPLNFVNFRVQVAGKAVAVQSEVRALHEGRDVTPRLRAAGLPISVADPSFEAAAKRLGKALRAQLEKAELVIWEEQNPWPNWTTRVQFYWTQRFPAGAAIEVTHTYRPIIGGSYITQNMDGAPQVKPYCGGADALARIGQWKAAHPKQDSGDIQLYERQIQYILTTANHWSGPIGKFHLTLTTGKPEHILLTCLPGVKPTAPGRYEMHAERFRPLQELDVLILTPEK